MRLDPEQQAAARTLLLRLADEDESGAIVRRRVALAELDAERSARSSTGSPTAACSRSATARSRSRTRRCCASGRGCAPGWTRTREGRRLHRQLARRRARVGRGRPRPRRALPRRAPGRRRSTGRPATSPSSTRPSARSSTTSRRASGRAQRRLRVVLAGVASLLVLAVIAGVVALDQRGRARAEATAAAAQRLGAQALVGAATSTARCCSRARASRSTTRSQTRGNLLAALLKSPAAIGVLRGDGDGLTSVALSPDDRTLAFVDTDGTLRRLDARTRRPLAPAADRARLPDGLGRTCASATTARGSRSGGDEAAILDAAHAARARPAGLDGVRLRSALLAGRAHAVRHRRGPWDGTSSSASTRAAAGRSGEPRVRRPRRRHRSPRWSLTRDGRRVVTSVEDGPTVIRDARTLRPLKRLPAGRGGDGPEPRRAHAARRRARRLGALRRPRHRRRPARRRAATTAWSSRAAFSADGRTAVTAGEDSRVIVWDVRRAAARETLDGPRRQSSPASRSAATAARSTAPCSTARSSSGTSPATAASAARSTSGRAVRAARGSRRSPATR